MRKVFFIFLVAAILIVPLTPVTGRNLTSVKAQDESFTCPNQGGTMVVTYGTDPRTLSGLYANDGNSLFVASFMAEPLLFGGENWGDTIEPVLAESWDISDDGLQYTFHLRQDVLWSDGQPFTAEDVLFTYQAVQLEENAIDWRPNLMQGDTPMQFEVVDDHTFKVILSEPDAAVLTALAIPIVPKHAFTDLNMVDAPYNTNPITTGPFKFVKWDTGESITLDANPDYWRGAPCLDRIVVRFIEGPANTANAILAGEVDFARVDGADVTPFENNPDFVLQTASRDLMRYVGFNVRSPNFSDAAVRRALAVGLDRQAIIDAAAGGYGVVADSLFNKAVFMYQEGRNKQYPYDPAQAQQMLADAGWTDTNGDGILDKDGNPMTMRVVYLGSWSLMQAIAPIVYDNWHSLGVDVQLTPLDEAKAYEDIYDNVSEDKPYDAVLGGWGLFGPEPDHYRNYLASPTSFFAYNNTEVQALFDQGRSVTDPQKRYDLYAHIDSLLWDDLPMIPIYQAIGAWAYPSNLEIAAAELNGTFLTGLKYPGRVYFKP
jgi:peptide/nickel transport system substrate-binding protein